MFLASHSLRVDPDAVVAVMLLVSLLGLDRLCQWYWVKVAPKNGQKLLKICQKSKKLLAKVEYFTLNNFLKQHAEIVWGVI